MKIKKSHIFVCFKVKNVKGNFFEMILCIDKKIFFLKKWSWSDLRSFFCRWTWSDLRSLLKWSFQGLVYNFRFYLLKNFWTHPVEMFICHMKWIVKSVLKTASRGRRGWSFDTRLIKAAGITETTQLSTTLSVNEDMRRLKD
jgi:hypothetical protein